MQRFALPLCVFLTCALIGCSSAGENVTAPEQAVERATQSDNSHVLWESISSPPTRSRKPLKLPPYVPPKCTSTHSHSSNRRRS